MLTNKFEITAVKIIFEEKFWGYEIRKTKQFP